jgi:uncharacterized protein
MASLTFNRLAASKYLLVTTFRRNGTAVPTPVWHAVDGETLVVWTVVDSGKVKRLRNNPEVRLAPCTARGRPTGPETPARGELLDAAGSARVRQLISRRYGVIGRLAMFGSRLRRGTDGSVGLRFTVAP